MKKILVTTLTMFMLITPIFSIPKLPTIPKISAETIELPEGYKKAAEKAGAEAVKNLNINWVKLFNSIN